jgi:hypothetical protein
MKLNQYSVHLSQVQGSAESAQTAATVLVSQMLQRHAHAAAPAAAVAAAAAAAAVAAAAAAVAASVTRAAAIDRSP